MSREVFTTCNGLAVNCVLYQESGLINLWGAGVYYDGFDCWEVNSSGVITGTSSCVPSPTPTPTPTPTPSPQSYYEYNIGQDYGTAGAACSNFASDTKTTVYAAESSPGLVTAFFIDTVLSIEFVGNGNYYAWRLGSSGPSHTSGLVSSAGFPSGTAGC